MKKYSIILSLLVLLACEQPTNELINLDHLQYIEGTWKSKVEENGIFFDLTMTKKSCIIDVKIIPKVCCGEKTYTYSGNYRLYQEYDLNRKDQIRIVTDELEFEIGNIEKSETVIDVYKCHECGIQNKFGLIKVK